MPKIVTQKIKTCLPPSADYGNDEFIIARSTHTGFFVSGMYTSLIRQEENDKMVIWRRV